MRRYSVISAVLGCAMFSTPLVGAVAGYDLGPGNALLNRVLPQTRRIDTPPVFEKTSVFQSLARRQQQPQGEDLSASLKEGSDPLLVFSQNEDFLKLKDAALTRDVALALGKNKSLQDELFTIRKQLTSEWDEWFSNERKDENYATLCAAYEKLLKKSKTVEAESTHDFATQTVLADYNNTEFVSQMLQAIRGSAYHSLLFFVLGYSQWDEGNAREINGVLLNDKDTLGRILADIIVSYRRKYDAVFAGACLSTGLTFSRESTESAAFFKEQMQSQFLGTSVSESSPLYARWQAVLSAARAYAHKDAAEFINAKISKITQLLTLFAARLEVVRVADAQFSYPNLAQALSNKLTDASVCSILLGLAYRVSQQLLMQHEYIVNAQQTQTFFVQEYQGQHRLQHISREVLSGERFLKTSNDVEKKQRKAFEVRCAVLFGDVDFLLQGAFDTDQQNALADCDVARGAELYKKIMVVMCQRNGGMWDIVSPERKARMHLASSALLKKVQSEVWAYLKILGIEANSSEALHTAYESLLDKIAWTDKERVLFTTGSPVFFSQNSRAKRGKIKANATLYQSLYRFFWLCVGARLLGDVVRGDQAAYVVQDGEVDASTQTQILERQSQELVRQAQSEQISESDASLTGALTQAQKRLASFGSTMGGRVEQLKGNALRYASGQSDMRSLNTDILHSLDDSSHLLDGMQQSIKAVFNRSDQSSDRLVGSIKASLILVDRCVELCSKQMKTVRTGFLKFYTFINKAPGVGNLMRKFIGGHIKKMLTEVNRDNEVPLARIKLALADMQLVLQGKKRSNELSI